MRLFLLLSLLALMAWGSLAIIAGHYGLDIFPLIGWLKFLLLFTAPWASLIGGLLLWKQARIWRRLHHRRIAPEPLTRTPDHIAPAPNRPSVLERTALAIAALGAATMLYWLHLPGPEYLVMVGVVVWFWRGVVLVRLKPSVN